MVERNKFERTLWKMGYRRREPIHPKQEKVLQPVKYEFEGGQIVLTTFIIPYYTKKSYLWLEHLDGGDVKTLAKRIRYNQPGRIYEVGYEAQYTVHPSEISRNVRKSVMMDFIKMTRKNLKEGMLGFTPNEGDIVAAFPHGPKIDMGFNASSLAVGRRQRAAVARRFGFGQLYSDDFQYSIYDSEGNLSPL